MSRSNDTRGRAARLAGAALIGFVALGCASAAPALDEPIDMVTMGSSTAQLSDEVRPRGSAAQTPEDKQAEQARAPKAPRSLLRCWQGGRLIYEGRGYGTLPQAQIAAELKPGDGASGRVQVLDLYQGLCVLELPK